MNATEKKQELAAATFRSGYNCAQSVLSSFSSDFNIERDTLLRLASPFGSGIAKTQETCGAVTGGIMAIGLKYGKGINGTEEEKARTYELSRRLITEFSKEHDLGIWGFEDLRMIKQRQVLPDVQIYSSLKPIHFQILKFSNFQIRMSFPPASADVPEWAPVRAPGRKSIRRQ